jgi:hypothetical protein
MSVSILRDCLFICLYILLKFIIILLIVVSYRQRHIKKVIKGHRTLTTYIEVLLQEGFKIEHIIEPKPIENNEETKDEFRRPMMLIIGVVKE